MNPISLCISNGCNRGSQKQDAKKPKNPSKIVALVKANKDAQAEVEQKRQEYHDAFGDYMDGLNAEGYGSYYDQLKERYGKDEHRKLWVNFAREQFHLELSERIEALYQENKGDPELLQIMIDGFEIIWFRTKKQAEAAAKMFLESKDADSLIDASEAAEDLLTAQDLYTLETTYKPAQRHRGHAERRPTYTLDYNRILNYMVQNIPNIKADQSQDLEWAKSRASEICNKHQEQPDSYVENWGDESLSKSNQLILQAAKERELQSQEIKVQHFLKSQTDCAGTYLSEKQAYPSHE